ncbi:unnamed protein product, partial [Brenthis ino]
MGSSSSKKVNITGSGVQQNAKSVTRDRVYTANEQVNEDQNVEILEDSNAAARSRGHKMPIQPIKLYYLVPSPPSRSVMMTAKMLGLELDLVHIDIFKGEHKTPEFLKMNPQHTVPTMDDNGFILRESRAIMIYLMNAYGRDDSLYPKNPRQRALVHQRLDFDLGTLYRRYMDLYVPMILDGAKYSEEAAAKLNEALDWLNKMLDGRAFVAGDNLTLADISIVVVLSNLEALEFDYSAHENVAKWFERMKKELEPYGYVEIDQVGAQALASLLKKDKN